MYWLVLAAIALGAVVYFGGAFKSGLKQRWRDTLRGLVAGGFGALAVLFALSGRIGPSILAASLVFLLARPMIQTLLARYRQNGSQARAGAARHKFESMSREEALAVLGLGPGASREDVKQAYHRLMLKLHPDQGGTDYLAAKINRAKEILLGD